MTFEQMLTIHLQKKVNRFRSILMGSSQPGPTGSLAIWFESVGILTQTRRQGAPPFAAFPKPEVSVSHVAEKSNRNLPDIPAFWRLNGGNEPKCG